MKKYNPNEYGILRHVVIVSWVGEQKDLTVKEDVKKNTFLLMENNKVNIFSEGWLQQKCD